MNQKKILRKVLKKVLTLSLLQQAAKRMNSSTVLAAVAISKQCTVANVNAVTVVLLHTALLLQLTSVGSSLRQHAHSGQMQCHLSDGALRVVSECCLWSALLYNAKSHKHINAAKEVWQ
jgi:hypothetical protein